MNVKMENCWLVLSGDWGGQIYLAVPLWLVPDFPELEVQMTDPPSVAITEFHGHHQSVIRVFRVQRLLRVLDRGAWPGNRGEGTDIGLFVCGEGDARRVPGGMGGGELTDGLWLHPEFSHPNERRRAEELLGLRT